MKTINDPIAFCQSNCYTLYPRNWVRKIKKSWLRRFNYIPQIIEEVKFYAITSIKAHKMRKDIQILYLPGLSINQMKRIGPCM